ncbi:hypothetical protein Anapl_01267 [Anas platyrhynchos]|uniref:Uncharacterized protein n=1 Tax=Anas platyrhynchos TaxID=8839 RepID=R0LWN9_ANAPL|nr:hypothetical protein Anapl_01267 [Anas platyrhynchos]
MCPGLSSRGHPARTENPTCRLCQQVRLLSGVCHQALILTVPQNTDPGEHPLIHPLTVSSRVNRLETFTFVVFANQDLNQISSNPPQQQDDGSVAKTTDWDPKDLKHGEDRGFTNGHADQHSLENKQTHSKGVQTPAGRGRRVHPNAYSAERKPADESFHSSAAIGSKQEVKNIAIVSKMKSLFAKRCKSSLCVAYSYFDCPPCLAFHMVLNIQPLKITSSSICVAIGIGDPDLGTLWNTASCRGRQRSRFYHASTATRLEAYQSSCFRVSHEIRLFSRSSEGTARPQEQSCFSISPKKKQEYGGIRTQAISSSWDASCVLNQVTKANASMALGQLEVACGHAIWCSQLSCQHLDAEFILTRTRLRTQSGKNITFSRDWMLHSDDCCNGLLEFCFLPKDIPSLVDKSSDMCCMGRVWLQSFWTYSLAPVYLKELLVLHRHPQAQRSVSADLLIIPTV